MYAFWNGDPVFGHHQKQYTEYIQRKQDKKS